MLPPRPQARRFGNKAAASAFEGETAVGRGAPRKRANCRVLAQVQAHPCALGYAQAEHVLAVAPSTPGA